MVEEARMNIKAKQTEGESSEIGSTAFDYALKKKWIEVYLYLLVWLIVYVDNSAVPEIVKKHRYYSMFL